MAVSGYSKTQISLHWGIALLMLVSFFSHEAMKTAWRGFLRGQDAVTVGTQVHVLAGIVILALVTVRLLLRWRRGVPDQPASSSPAMRMAAHGGHGVLYLLMILLPVSGLVAWFGGVREAGDAHEIMFNALWIVVALHSVAALFHHYVLKDGLLSRMKPFGAKTQ